jgi:acetoin utilization protein AcuB
MKHMPQVIAMMTPFPYSIDVEATVAEARLMMDARRIRHLPVTEGGRLSGVISDRDLRVAAGPGPERAASSPLRVRDVYSEDTYAVEADTPLDEVAATMAQRHIGSAVVTKAGKLVGVFTVTDACLALARVLRERFPPPGPGTAAA